MAKFICAVCGYIYEGNEAPAKCPICKAPASKFSQPGPKVATELQKINDEDYEIIKKIEEEGTTNAVDWYKETYECDVEEAKNTIAEIKVKYGVYSKVDLPNGDNNSPSSGTGCMVTILIAITSTLSVFFML